LTIYQDIKPTPRSTQPSIFPG